MSDRSKPALPEPARPAGAPWAVGDYLTHDFNPELGVGRIASVDARSLVVEFARTGASLRLAATTDVLTPVSFDVGRPVRLVDSGEETTVAGPLPDGRLRLANGRAAEPSSLWPLMLDGALLERLSRGEVDAPGEFLLRLRMLRLLEVREAGGLGSFLGGRVRLFPHQLHVAEKACAREPVRWLLADEVGLGKTIEAALILNRLVHTGRVERCLVVVPDALSVQWLGELWRKYHQVFTLLDAARLADVARDFGATFNPFELHRRAVIALETLVERPELTAQAVAAGIDLLVVDEAQRLRRPPGHPGEPAWRAVAPIAQLGRHVLLLTATPLEDDVHGFFRLLQLLRPDEFPEDTSFEARLASGAPLPPCTSSTRRVDIGGLPPRQGTAIPIDDPGGITAEVEAVLREAPAPHAIARQKKIDRLRRALCSGSALRAVLGPDEARLRELAEQMDRRDPRLDWLAAQARRWRDAGEKTLVFVAHRETLELVRTALGQRAQLATGVFHEELTPARRDTEVARFREAEGPSVLVSTECGGEGRNFEFCRRLILFDLPWKPTTVEQRIGRLDRIGRRIPVEIVYFQPSHGIGADITRLFDALGLFREPLAGLEPELAHVERAIEGAAADAEGVLSETVVAELVRQTSEARTRVREAAYQQLHREPYHPGLADALLSRVPADLDARNQDVIATACARLGFTIERPQGHRVFSFELGNEALVDGLPGVPGGSTFIGTFDREEAVERETIDFFSSGHPLVEGVFAHLEESPFGRVARLVLAAGADRGEGLVAVYKDASGTDIDVIDTEGRARLTWRAALERRGAVSRPSREDAVAIDWRRSVERTRMHLDRSRRLHAVAAIVVRPAP